MQILLLTYLLSRTYTASQKLANILAVPRASKHISDRVLRGHTAKCGNAEIAHSRFATLQGAYYRYTIRYEMLF